MKLPWERLAEHLRAELGELGGLIRLLELQRESKLSRDAVAPRGFETDLSMQAAAVRRSRTKREKILLDFLPAHGASHRMISSRVLEEVAPEARPLIQALSEEVERLNEHLHRLVRRLPAATQRKLHHIMKSSRQAPGFSAAKQRTGQAVSANGS